MKIKLHKTHGKRSIYILAWDQLLTTYHWQDHKSLHSYVNPFDDQDVYMALFYIIRQKIKKNR